MASNDPIIILNDVPMDEVIPISDEDNDEPSGVIFETESDDDNLLVNALNEIEDMNDFKEPLPARNLFQNGRFDVELNETEHANTGASNDGFMAQNNPDFNSERLYINNETKLYKLLYTTSAKLIKTHIDHSINELMKKIPRHEAYRIYQDQLDELSHAKYTMKIVFTNFIKQYSQSGPDRIVNGYISMRHQTLSRKYSHKVLHCNILVYIMHIDTENDSIMNILIPVRKIRKSKST